MAKTKEQKKQILKDLEFSGKRGFYCGSTIILYRNLKAASINIRSATIDLNSKEFFYGSGGGVTRATGFPLRVTRIDLPVSLTLLRSARHVALNFDIVTISSSMI